VTDIEKLRANAAMAVETLKPLSDVADFGFNRDSVAWVEGYIERQRVRTEMSAVTKDGLVSVLGSFLGECILHCHGGEWRRDDNGWGINFDDGNAAYPFAKVRKQFDNGIDAGDSILGFLDSVGALFKTQIATAKKQKSWWKFW
jgi:hypothetical protein